MSKPYTMDQRRARRTGLKAAGVSFLAFLVMTVVFLCWFLGIRCGEDLTAYRNMASEGFHPIWKDLAWRKVRRGTDLAEMVRKHPPTSRENFGPYAVLDYDSKNGSFNTVLIAAANGSLIYAGTDKCFPRHAFFDSPGEMQAFNEAWARHRTFRRLEYNAWQIHRAISAGQDVFVSRRIDRRDTADSNDPRYYPDQIRQLEEAYGREYLRTMMGKEVKLTVEVSKVLSGDLGLGTTLTFSAKDCRDADLAEPETVFLHVEDSRIINPASKGSELYTTVPAKALALYDSLTTAQIKDLEARCLGGRGR